jgi:ElaB/YqjD/DUF883 family membrane-anchored ribosome-binding protein
MDPPTLRAAMAPAQRLRQNMAAARVSLRWLGVRKTLTQEQKDQAAESFGAAGAYLSARKKLLDTQHAAFKEVTAVRGRLLSYWKGVSLPYPESGVRLIKHAQVERFHEQMSDFREELDVAVAKLDRHCGELKSAARTRLGSLYEPDDYPDSLVGWFGVEWDFSSVEPPEYLLQLNREIYEQEKERVAQRFQQAVELAEQAFLSEFAKLIGHLTERLRDSEDGTKKVFRDSAITNLVEFFDRFRQLNVRSNQDLDALVDRAQQVVRGVGAQDLRSNGELRQRIADHLAQVQKAMEPMVTDLPRRRIIRGGGA